ncbi:AraC family transcriptional regulator [Ligilactobacillus sp. WILCCON 0076]|uniref:AraC family transcriptional regulator n=1 Tax=Ligilactobacillus ubinensis TaxID=2876789 RepID=A0A9X2JMW7_9LACO|nr:AraC family transcriptional regulator [Ligilactobacillus ubinensis]MCP0888089.1 AraC family transcriptional regulator [Ligilactobacillus ubinensis]
MQINHEIINLKDYFPFKIFDFHAKDLTRRVPFHWHQSTELLFCLEGSLNIELVNQKFHLTPNNAMIINPNVVHSTFSSEHNWILCLQLPLSFLQSLTFGKYNQSFVFNLNTLNKHENTSNLIAHLKRLTSILDIENKAISDNIDIYSVTLDIISYLTKYFQKPIQANSNNDGLKFINLFIQFINQNYMNDITLHDVAHYFSYSDTYCSKLIKANLGMNFKNFLISVRLNQAIQLMLLDKQSFTVIAEKCGFESYRNFYNSFTATYHTSPSYYKRKQLE